MGTLKDRLNDDLRTAMKGRDELTTSTLRLALTAVRNAEVQGKQARELSDDDVLDVLKKESKKRRDAATAFADAGRPARSSTNTCRPRSPTTSSRLWSRRRWARAVSPPRHRWVRL
jgi:hypothetical protein